MKITVVRHGETEGNVARIVQSRTDGILSPLGKTQVEATATLLSHEPFTHIYSSDLGRCRQTADIIAIHHRQIPIVYNHLLRERNQGIYEGGSWDDLPWLEHEGDNLHVPMPDGESWIDVYKRVGDVLNDLYAKHPDGNILIVTHGGILKAFKAHLDNIPLRSAVDDHASKNAQVHQWEVKQSIKP